MTVYARVVYCSDGAKANANGSAETMGDYAGDLSESPKAKCSATSDKAGQGNGGKTVDSYPASGGKSDHPGIETVALDGLKTPSTVSVTVGASADYARGVRPNPRPNDGRLESPGSHCVLCVLTLSARPAEMSKSTVLITG